MSSEERLKAILEVIEIEAANLFDSGVLLGEYDKLSIVDDRGGSGYIKIYAKSQKWSHRTIQINSRR